MQCSNCGTINPEGAKFCRGCGHPLPSAPAAQPALSAPPPAVAPSPPPAAPPGRLGQPLDGADLLLALIGTGLGALAGILSKLYLPSIALQYQLLPFALAVAVTTLAVLASFLALAPMVYWVADSRATRERMQLKKLIQKEQAVFTSIDADVSLLVGQEG